MFFCVQLAHDPVYIMVIYKRIQLHSSVNTTILIKFSSNGMCDFKIIMIIVSGIQTFVKFIVCNAMKHAVTILNITAVVSVNHFTHKPEIFFLCLCTSAHFFHKSKIKAVCTVQTDSVNIKNIDPEINYFIEVIFHLGILQIQIYQFKAVSPCLISKSIIIRRIPSEIDSLIPAAILGTLPVLLNVFKCKKFSSRMIKHTIYYYFYIIFMSQFHKLYKILIVPQSLIYFFIILCIISVSGRFK